MKAKKAQIQSQIFLYVLAAVLVLLLIIFSYRTIGSLKEKQRKVNVAEVETRIRSGIDQLSEDYGSVRKTEVRPPADTDLVCFVDLSKRDELLGSSLLEEYPEIKESVENYILKNVFLISKRKVTDIMYVGSLCFERPYYKCIETPEHLLKIMLKGRGDCVDIIKPIPALKINNVRNESKYTPKPIFAIRDSQYPDERTNILRLVPITMWNDQRGGITYYPFYVYYEKQQQPSAEFVVDYLLNKHSAAEMRFFGTPPNSLIGYPNVNYEIFDEPHYRSYWSFIIDVVLVNTSNREAAVVSSLFASFLSAPLVFVDKDTLALNKEYLNGTRVYVIDQVDREVNDFMSVASQELMDYASEDLRNDPELNPYQELISNITPSIYVH